MMMKVDSDEVANAAAKIAYGFAASLSLSLSLSLRLSLIQRVLVLQINEGYALQAVRVFVLVLEQC